MKHFQIPLTIFLRRKQNLNVQRLPIQKSNNEATPDYESHPPLSDLPQNSAQSAATHPQQSVGLALTAAQQQNR